VISSSLVVKVFFIDWRIPKLKEDLLRKNDDYCEILRWFLDFPGFPHIYSIQHLVQCGMKYDKLPGEWHGPSTASLVLRDLSKIHRLRYQGEIAVLVTQSETIYISEVEKLCSNLSLNENFFGLGLGLGDMLLNNATFTEKFHRLSMDRRQFNRKKGPNNNKSSDQLLSSLPLLSIAADQENNKKNKNNNQSDNQNDNQNNNNINNNNNDSDASNASHSTTPLSPPPPPSASATETDKDKDSFFDPLFRPPPSQVTFVDNSIH
jgi:hypothetical protein